MSCWQVILCWIICLICREKKKWLDSVVITAQVVWRKNNWNFETFRLPKKKHWIRFFKVENLSEIRKQIPNFFRSNSATTKYGLLRLKVSVISWNWSIFYEFINWQKLQTLLNWSCHESFKSPRSHFSRNKFSTWHDKLALKGNHRIRFVSVSRQKKLFTHNMSINSVEVILLQRRRKKRRRKENTSLLTRVQLSHHSGMLQHCKQRQTTASIKHNLSVY